jgi:hypothetical protein
VYSCRLLSCAATAALAVYALPANATTVATIDGNYDVTSYDTPSLIFHNTSGGTFINAQMVLSGYQNGTLNASATQSVTLPNMAAGDTTVTWGGPLALPGQLFGFDYDDSYANTGYSNPGCVLSGPYCALVGNFKVTFTATILGGAFDGKSIFSVFSPTTNATGSFVGWQGLDPTGLSESIYDQHSPGINNATVGGTLANIDLGTPPAETPIPAALPLFASGLGVIGFLAKRRKRMNATALAAA